jgi:6-pyruvoyl-tetrahydropterin synthase
MAGKCERLHGHNYAVSVALEGPLGADSYVFDFVALKEIVRRISDALDHRFLLPLHNEHLETRESEGHWEIRFGARRYRFPARDVLPLPLDNVTAERLAEYIKIYVKACGHPMDECPASGRLPDVSLQVVRGHRLSRRSSRRRCIVRMPSTAKSQSW